jgi:hypothetical protein
MLDPRGCRLLLTPIEKPLRLTLLGSAIFVAFALPGCATVVTVADGRELAIRSPEFRNYVEHVFREQNRVATALLFAQEEAEGGRAQTLLGLEDSLLLACAGLNELAAARRDERPVSIARQARVAREAPGCEAATLSVEREMRRLGPGEPVP